MSTETVIYSVPVEVEVNTETGEVESVVVLDDESSFDGRWASSPEAVKIAESAEWPSWEFGR